MVTGTVPAFKVYSLKLYLLMGAVVYRYVPVRCCVLAAVSLTRGRYLKGVALQPEPVLGPKQS